ncbi:MAG: M67 family metallopeptidase [Pyrinomonadaceae bacterium MAG19_C2-C3]|nr:M67 family metallopeptidase [Pyrinomonadaceae bacterium MAG19_C2-C3]
MSLSEPQRRGEREGSAESFALTQAQMDEMVRHAREAVPHECCGVVGGFGNRADTIYMTGNVAAHPATTYEAAPEDLFAAQRAMRARGEELIAIYHSHPQAADAVPSGTDVRLAFYPHAVYIIIAVKAGGDTCVRGFRLYADTGRWESVSLHVVE